MIKIVTSLIPAIIILLSGCSGISHQYTNGAAHDLTADDSILAAQYHIANYFGNQTADTILVNAVAFVGRKPAAATSVTRFNNEFRNYYRDYAKDFYFFLYAITNDSINYFYMIRPARCLEGNRRGVIGSFRIKEDLSLYDFMEIANTKVKPEQELQKAGITLFSELLRTGNIDKYLSDSTLIEWPDERLKYNKSLNEWRYTDPDQL